MPSTILDRVKRALAPLVLPVAVRDETPPTFEDGDVRPLSVDATGSLRVASAEVVSYLGSLVAGVPSPARYANFGAAAKAVVKGTYGRLFSVHVASSAATTHYLQLFDAAEVPEEGTAPLFSFAVPAGASVVVGRDFFLARGFGFDVGLAWAWSSTRAVLTAGSAAAQATHVLYE